MTGRLCRQNSVNLRAVSLLFLIICAHAFGEALRRVWTNNLLVITPEMRLPNLRSHK
jgi:hypothetical protein